ncbi:MAG: hypothetical protein Pg6B_04530 [Candidatus Azobacteroides pseudotrichonymphae]|uniref:Uncharacterized protein n=1 Tax=Candidatus Improbicoccus pseudotrichonymphae TaxID=3033792 RepID=A0AA48KWU2_9FIRM|nr:MAG: hypothetical protein CfP315_0205 [Candidatus Improbicoccus pseudotrichonymphae]GMO34113.1 MAG: hypothetical protein Pg6B_04530 [Candidatus Azobacteroides pseudotrichonymphae]
MLNISFKRIVFYCLLIPILAISFNKIFASGNLENKISCKIKSDFRIPKFVKIKKYSEKEISEFEKKWNIKFPKLAKDMYTHKINIRDLIFKSENEDIKKIYVNDVMPLSKNKKMSINKLIEIYKTNDDERIGGIEFLILHHSTKKISNMYICPPSKTAIPFAYESSEDGLFYIDKNCIWYYSFENKYHTKFCLIN